MRNWKINTFLKQRLVLRKKFFFQKSISILNYLMNVV